MLEITLRYIEEEVRVTNMVPLTTLKVSDLPPYISPDPLKVYTRPRIDKAIRFSVYPDRLPIEEIEEILKLRTLKLYRDLMHEINYTKAQAEIIDA